MTIPIHKCSDQETGYRVLSPHEAEAELPPTQKEMELSGVDIIGNLSVKNICLRNI